MQPESTKFQYNDGVSDLLGIDPDKWLHDQTLLDRPANLDIQLDLFHDYGTNVALYPAFKAYLRDHGPPTLIISGANDKILPAAGAYPFKRDLPDAERHLLDSWHFVLEDKLDVAAPLIHDFLDRKLAQH
jgi:pimeloyl-ACP methyl ester carboxylesterase